MGGIKSPSRGIEKADAAYGGDVSRLLDVCRESIIFETIEDMAACLQVGSFFDLAKLSSRPFSSLLSPCASDVDRDSHRQRRGAVRDMGWSHCGKFG